MITTNIDGGGNSSSRRRSRPGPVGPVWLRDSRYRNPSLFFDDDGRCIDGPGSAPGRAAHLPDEARREDGEALDRSGSCGTREAATRRAALVQDPRALLPNDGGGGTEYGHMVRSRAGTPLGVRGRARATPSHEPADRRRRAVRGPPCGLGRGARRELVVCSSPSARVRILPPSAARRSRARDLGRGRLAGRHGGNRSAST